MTLRLLKIPAVIERMPARHTKRRHGRPSPFTEGVDKAC